MYVFDSGRCRRDDEGEWIRGLGLGESWACVCVWVEVE